MESEKHVKTVGFLMFFKVFGILLGVLGAMLADVGVKFGFFGSSLRDVGPSWRQNFDRDRQNQTR